MLMSLLFTWQDLRPFPVCCEQVHAIFSAHINTKCHKYTYYFTPELFLTDSVGLESLWIEQNNNLYPLFIIVLDR